MEHDASMKGFDWVMASACQTGTMPTNPVEFPQPSQVIRAQLIT